MWRSPLMWWYRSAFLYTWTFGREFSQFRVFESVPRRVPRSPVVGFTGHTARGSYGTGPYGTTSHGTTPYGTGILRHRYFAAEILYGTWTVGWRVVRSGHSLSRLTAGKGSKNGLESERPILWCESDIGEKILVPKFAYLAKKVLSSDTCQIYS